MDINVPATEEKYALYVGETRRNIVPDKCKFFIKKEKIWIVLEKAVNLDILFVIALVRGKLVNFEILRGF